MLEKNFNTFVDDLIKSFMKEYCNIDKQIEESNLNLLKVQILGAIK